jgi:hypothetical protein
MPCMMHGEALQFVDRLSGKYETPTTYAQYPNINIVSFFSRVLDMKVCCRVSKSALWYIEQEYGGFDEYMMTTPDAYMQDEVARMYREKIRVEFEKKKETFRKEAKEVLLQYGPEYIEYFVLFGLDLGN